MRLQLFATVRTEREISSHIPITEPASQCVRQRRSTARRRWREGMRLWKHELAVLTIQKSVFPWPPPNGNEEKFQNFVVFNKISAWIAVDAPSHTWFHHLANLVFYPSCKEEEHFSTLSLSLAVNNNIAEFLCYAVNVAELLSKFLFLESGIFERVLYGLFVLWFLIFFFFWRASYRTPTLLVCPTFFQSYPFRFYNVKHVLSVLDYRIRK